MTRNASLLTALCSAIAIDVSGGDVPEWVHLLPAGEIRTVDGRGPYRVTSMQSVAAMLTDGAKLPIDENHATDKGGKALGMPAPARGWIVALEAREDGLWGKVEWTGAGRQLMADRAYAGISPVILHSKSGEIAQVLRASLTNTPNLEGLTALHSEGPAMDWKAKLIELLGLDSTASDEAILAALTAMMNENETATQSQEIGPDHPTIIALQSELTDVTGKLNALTEGGKRKDAAAFVDGEIKRGRVGLKPMRDTYIALHMEDAERAEKLIGALPVLSGSTVTGKVIAESDAKGFDAGDRTVMSLMGIGEEEYAQAQSRLGLKKETL
jgi:phage I-like protein